MTRHETEAFLARFVEYLRVKGKIYLTYWYQGEPGDVSDEEVEELIKDFVKKEE